MQEKKKKKQKKNVYWKLSISVLANAERLLSS